MRLDAAGLRSVSRNAPEWVLASLDAAPWVVVRRTAPIAGLVSVGVRGATRSERFAATAPVEGILERLRPQDLVSRQPARAHPAFEAMAALRPALDAALSHLAQASLSSPLPGGERACPGRDPGSRGGAEAGEGDRGFPERARPPHPALRADLSPLGRGEGRRPTSNAIALAQEATGLAWGPGGSAGFELATGRPTLTPDSDLDVVIRTSALPPVAAWGPLSAALEKSPLRVDVLVETPSGGVALAELLGGGGEVHLRTASGPRLVPLAALLAEPARC
nr:phosphoribosyl-dephospho-CoA transferase MdcG domain-containing protein [Methylopila sp. M107]